MLRRNKFNMVDFIGILLLKNFEIRKNHFENFTGTLIWVTHLFIFVCLSKFFIELILKQKNLALRIDCYD